MFDGYHGMWWGMHWGWWFFWILIVLGALWLLARTREPSSPPPSHETPLDLLQRRYAAGEMSTEDYEERKARLENEPA